MPTYGTTLAILATICLLLNTNIARMYFQKTCQNREWTAGYLVGIIPLSLHQALTLVGYLMK